GAGYNRARQRVLAEGVELLETHHNRKAGGGVKRSAPSLDDVYGSTWIASGSGSVIFLAGAAGDPIVSLHHLKQPAAEVGPLKVSHDHDRGRSSVWHSTDLVAMLAANLSGVTAKDAAGVIFETEAPNSAQVEKARRRLD